MLGDTTPPIGMSGTDVILLVAAMLIGVKILLGK